MRILFIGTFFPEIEKQNIIKNSVKSIQNAANILQWDYIYGLKEFLESDIDLLTKVSVGTFPFGFNKAYIKTQRFYITNFTQGISMGFINFFGLKQLIYPNLGIKEITEWIKQNDAKEKVLIVYSYLYSNTIIKIKKRFPNIKIILIILDLPIFTHLDKNNFLYDIKREIEMKNLLESLKFIDGLVCISEHTRDKIDPHHQINSIIIEGMVNCNDSYEEKRQGLREYFQFAYTGTLTRKYGISELVYEFKKIKRKDVRLVICGGGELANFVSNESVKDTRIVYKGIVSEEQASKIQQQSDILLNPRKNDEEYTKYSFPSKNLQYMKSGVPVLCYKLDGIPDEYDEFLIYVKEGRTLHECMEILLESDAKELQEIGHKGAQFVIANKNNKVQCERLLSLIK